MHPNRATSTLFSNFLLIPAELTRLIKSQGHKNLTAIVQPKKQQSAAARERRSIDIPLGTMSDKIALPPKTFFELGYKPGDPLQFHYDGGRVDITPWGPACGTGLMTVRSMTQASGFRLRG